MGDGHDKGMVLHIRAADLKRAAPDFHEGAKNLSTALTTLVSTLDGLGKPWGDDKQGKEFGDAYSPLQKKIESAAGTLVLGLVSVHQALDDLADGTVDNEQLIAGMFTEVKTGEAAKAGSDGSGER
jgi:uncharacterized protein YukE